LLRRHYADVYEWCAAATLIIFAYARCRRHGADDMMLSLLPPPCELLPLLHYYADYFRFSTLIFYAASPRRFR